MPAPAWRLRDGVSTSGGEIATDVLGSGPPVVLVHGTPSWSYVWRYVAEELARVSTVYVWDLPGYGDSRPGAGQHASISLHARTLAELVEHWRLDSPVLVGHDIGGGAVLRAHLLEGVGASALALLDAAALPPYVTPATRHVQQHLAAYRSMPNHVFSGIVAGHLSTTSYPGLTEAASRAYLDRFAGPEGQRRYLDHVEWLDEADSEAAAGRLHEIAVPTSIVWGSHDQWLPLRTAFELRHRIPHSTLTVIANAGHFVTEDAPEAVSAALANLVAQVDQRPSG